MVIPETREIQAALSLSREGGFAGAAKDLGITQPAVSHRIAKLEQILGFSLFQRRPEGSVLTEEGRMLLPLMEEINSEFSKVMHLASYWKRATTNQLNVLIDGSVMSQAIHFKACSDGFAGAAENWSSPEGCPDWIDALKSYDTDLVIAGSFLANGELSGIRTSEIFRERGLTIAWNPGYYAINKEDFSFPEAVASSVILPAEPLAVGFRKFVTGWCASTYGLQLSGIIEADTEADAIQVCRQGMGVLLLPGEAGQRLGLAEQGLETAHSFRTLLPDAYVFGVRYRADERNPQALEAVERLVKNRRTRSGKQ